MYWGPAAPVDEIAAMLAATPLRALDFRGRPEELLEAAVDRLAAGKVVGWFQGRMEFGPRSLGARSILADPRDEQMRDRINALVKMREGFRPFAPAVLEGRAGEHFAIDNPAPFMLEDFIIDRETLPPFWNELDALRRQPQASGVSHKVYTLL